MLKKQTKYILAVALQVIIILALVLVKFVIFSRGTDILLRIEPVDPRDMLRGDYATFQYDISQVSQYLNKGAPLYNGDKVYVTLKQSGKYWRVNNIQSSVPTENDLYIKGTVVSGGLETRGMNTRFIRDTVSDYYTINYGIEQYFIPEGTGNNFNFANKEVSAKVKVDDKGNAIISGIYVNGFAWPK